MLKFSDIAIFDVNGAKHFRIGTVEFVLKAQREIKPGYWVISGELVPGSKVTLATLLAPFAEEIPLPQELGGIALNQITFEASPTSGTFAFTGVSSVDWDLSFGGVSLPTGNIEVSVSREVDGGSSTMRAAISLTTTRDVPVFDGFTFTGGSQLAFKWNPLPEDATDEPAAGDVWVVSGDLGANILDADFLFGLAITFTEESRTFMLEGRRISVEPLVEFENVGSLDALALNLNITKPSANETIPADAVQVNKKSSYMWSISAECNFALNIEPYVNFFQAGTLSISNGEEGIIFLYTTEESDLTIPLPIPQHEIALHLGLKQMSVSRASQGADTASTTSKSLWTFEANPAMWFTELPGWLDNIMPTLLTGTFKGSGDGIGIGIEQFFKPPFIAIPPITFGDTNIPLGEVGLDASNFLLNVGQTFDFSMDLGIAIPEEINHITGVDTNFFRTYEAGNYDSFARFQMIFDETYGLRFQPLNSPLGFVADDPDMPGWSIADFGDFGAFRFMMPAFGYSGTAFNARVGFEQIPERPLQIPLAPFKWLLQAAHLDGLNALIPAAIPIEGPDFFNDDGSFKLDDFIDQMERVSGIELPDAIRDALDAIAAAMESLPASLKDYLDFKLPPGFSLDVAIATTGSARIDFTTSDGGPLRLLTMAGLPLPSLMGVELHSFMLGEILTGSLFTTQVDARVDIFDLVTLGAALALPLEDLPLIDHVDQLQRRIVIDKLFMLIVYQTGIPVPIPLFFDELALEYRGLEDATFQTHWNFPMPQPDMSEILTTFDQFKRFFTEADYLLRVDDMPENLDLRLTIGANFLQLPDYLGGKMLGSKDSNTYSLWETVAHALNACKTLSLDEIIQAVPLHPYRLGSQLFDIYGINLGASWLITTPREFRDRAYASLGVQDWAVEDVLSVVPGYHTGDFDGLIVFLRGSLDYNRAVSLETIFGLAATEAGFRTALRIQGGLPSSVYAQLSGSFLIEPQQSPAFALEGKALLSIGDWRILDGSLSISDKRFVIDGYMSLFPSESPVQVNGELHGHITSSQFYVGGAIDIKITDHFTLAEASVNISQDDLKIAAKLFNMQAHFRLYANDGSPVMIAQLDRVNIADIFKIKEAGAIVGPQYGLLVQGETEVLGIVAAEGKLIVNDDRLRMDLAGKVFGLFESSVVLESKTFDSGASIYADVHLQSDFNDELARLIIQELKGTRDRIHNELEAAKQKVAGYKSKVDEFDNEITKWNNTLQDAFKTAQGELTSVNKASQEWRNKELNFDNKIVEAEGKATDAIQKATTALNNVNETLTNAQANVADWQVKIDEAEAELKEGKFWRAADLPGLYIAKESAQFFVNLIIEGIGSISSLLSSIPTAINSMVQGLKVLRDAAKEGLAQSDYLIDGLTDLMGEMQPATSTILNELKNLKTIAEWGLEQAENVLSGLQEVNSELFNALNQITDWAVGGSVAVRAARFQGALNAVSGGYVRLSVDLVVQGDEQHYEVEINMRDLEDGAKHLAGLIMGEMLMADVT